MKNKITLEIKDEEVKLKSELDNQVVWGFLLVTLVRLSRHLGLNEDDLQEMVSYTWKETKD